MKNVDRLQLRMSSPKEIANFICKTSLAKKGLSINLINSNSFTNVRRYRNYRNALLGNCINYVDGKPLSLYLALKNRQMRINSRGMEILTQTLIEQEGTKHKNIFVYFERSDDYNLLKHVQQYIQEDNVVLFPLSDRLDLITISQLLIQNIRTSSPHIVWIMLGSPKQEIVSSLISNSISSPVIGLGGVIDFVTGKVPEAPKFLQKIYLEWLFRLIREPFRLFKRYTFGNFDFLRAIYLDYIYYNHSLKKSQQISQFETIDFYLSSK